MIDYSCKAPWTWIVIDTNKDKWRFCCKTKWQDGFADGYDQHNDQKLIKIRQEFVDGQRPSECSSCWREEDLHGASYRTKVYGATTRAKLPTKSGLEFIDISFGDTCNLRCATCGPFNSTNWSSHMKQQKNVPYVWLTPLNLVNNQQQKAWQKIPQLVADNFNTLSHINLYGGEPSIDPNFITLMENLCDIDITPRSSLPIELRIYTNGVWPGGDKLSDRFVNLLVKAKEKGYRVDLKFSIDAIGDDAEYIRHPTKWNIVEKNIDHMVDIGITRRVHISTSLLNLPIHHEILEFFAEKNYREKIIFVNNLVNNPNIFSVANLGHKITRFAHLWKKLPNVPQWQPYVDWLHNLIETQLRGSPDTTRIEQFFDYADWYADVNSTTIPTKLQKAYLNYL